MVKKEKKKLKAESILVEFFLGGRKFDIGSAIKIIKKRKKIRNSGNELH